jgi:hypothetical protein
MRVKNEIKAKEAIKKRLFTDKLSTHKLDKATPKLP